jgi:hypothetical protein
MLFNIIVELVIAVEAALSFELKTPILQNVINLLVRFYQTAISNRKIQSLIYTSTYGHDVRQQSNLFKKFASYPKRVSKPMMLKAKDIKIGTLFLNP